HLGPRRPSAGCGRVSGPGPNACRPAACPPGAGAPLGSTSPRIASSWLTSYHVRIGGLTPPSTLRWQPTRAVCCSRLFGLLSPRSATARKTGDNHEVAPVDLLPLDAGPGVDSHLADGRQRLLLAVPMPAQQREGDHSGAMDAGGAVDQKRVTGLEVLG